LSALGRPPPLTVAEFAAFMRMHPTTVYALAKADKLPGVVVVRTGRAVRILLGEVLAASWQPSGVGSAAEAVGRSKGKPK
jgi:hypothetical protein